MVTGEFKNKVDKIWEIFWTGGVTNPLSVIEQFTYLLFIKGLDDRQNDLEADAALLGIEAEQIFGKDQQELRWSHFKQLPAEQMFALFTNADKGVFAFIKNLHDDKKKKIRLFPNICRTRSSRFQPLACWKRSLRPSTRCNSAREPTRKATFTNTCSPRWRPPAPTGSSAPRADRRGADRCVLAVGQYVCL